MFPDAKEEYFDEVIERQVKRMQIVIDLTRYIREKNNLSLKVRVISCYGGYYNRSSTNRRPSKNSLSSILMNNTFPM